MKLRLALALAALAGCTKNFAPADQLTSTRVLAIRATPVELEPDGGVTLEALVYVPDGGAAPSYTWAWCAGTLGGNATGLTCPVTQEQLSTALAPDGGITVDYSLGSAASATFDYPVAPEVLHSLCITPPTMQSDGGASDAGAEDGGATDAGADGGTVRTVVLACNDSATFDVFLTVGAGDAKLLSYRTLSVAFDAPTEVNTNPTLDGLTLTLKGATDPVAAGAALKYGQTYTLQAQVPASASDAYTNTNNQPFDPFQGGGFDPDAGIDDSDGGPDGGSRSVTRFEGLSLAWYVEAGTLGSATTTLAAGTASDAGTDDRDWSALLSNTWVAPSAPSGGAAQTVKFIVVVRDTRNGVGWLSQSFSVEP